MTSINAINNCSKSTTADQSKFQRKRCKKRWNTARKCRPIVALPLPSGQLTTSQLLSGPDKFPVPFTVRRVTDSSDGEDWVDYYTKEEDMLPVLRVDDGESNVLTINDIALGNSEHTLAQIESSRCGNAGSGAVLQPPGQHMMPPQLQPHTQQHVIQQLLPPPAHQVIRDYSCHLCGQTTATLQLMARHLITCTVVHKNQRLRNSCSYCLRKFQTNTELGEHQWQCSHEFKCPQCSLQFVSEFARKVHESKVHARPAVIHICPDCGVKCKNPWVLSRHRRLKHGGSSMRYRCKFCPTSFSRNDIRKRHELIHEHESITSYACPISNCSASFKRRDQFTRHLRAHDRRSKKCKDCEEHFASLLDLRDHPCGEPDIQPTEPCDWCDRLFHTKKIRSSHQSSCKQIAERNGRVPPKETTRRSVRSVRVKNRMCNSDVVTVTL